jgi:hypothetical protein
VVSVPKPVAETRPATTSRPAWNTPWPTAEEEKLRLFNAAQATARKTQALTQTTSFHARSGSDGVGRSGSASASKPEGSSSVTPFTAYSSSSKVAGGSSSSANRNNTSTSAPQYAMEAGGSSSSSNRPTATPQYPAKVPQYPTAEEEKAALKRYQDAKSAVDRTHGLSPGDGPSAPEPISYDALYPSASSSSRTAPATTSNSDLPPPFDATTTTSALPEKERLRRAYDAQDAAALSRQATITSPGAPGTYNYRNVSPPPFTNGGPSASGSGSGSSTLNNGRVPALRSGSQRGPPGGGGSRPPPAAPVASGSRVLSAAEEKAMLKAKYDAEDRTTNGSATPPILSASSSGGKSMTASSTTPPPLAPRPPAEYIRETREEDARVSRYVQQGITPPLDPPVNGLYRSFSPLGSPSSGPPPTR